MHLFVTNQYCFSIKGRPQNNRKLISVQKYAIKLIRSVGMYTQILINMIFEITFNGQLVKTYFVSGGY